MPLDDFVDTCWALAEHKLHKHFQGYRGQSTPICASVLAPDDPSHQVWLFDHHPSCAQPLGKGSLRFPMVRDAISRPGPSTGTNFLSSRPCACGASPQLKFAEPTMMHVRSHGARPCASDTQGPICSARCSFREIRKDVASQLGPFFQPLPDAFMRNMVSKPHV